MCDVGWQSNKLWKTTARKTLTSKCFSFNFSFLCVCVCVPRFFGAVSPTPTCFLALSNCTASHERLCIALSENVCQQHSVLSVRAECEQTHSMPKTGLELSVKIGTQCLILKFLATSCCFLFCIF